MIGDPIAPKLNPRSQRSPSCIQQNKACLNQCLHTRDDCRSAHKLAKKPSLFNKIHSWLVRLKLMNYVQVDYVQVQQSGRPPNMKMSGISLLTRGSTMMNWPVKVFTLSMRFFLKVNPRNQRKYDA